MTRHVSIRLWFAALLSAWGVLLPGAIRADEGHGPVILEGKVGGYAARVVIRPPPVIPGLADISVRVLSGDVREITVAPIKWNTGKKGAPRPDVAQRVPGEDRLYSAQLWFMEGGAHVVEVVLNGATGEGRVLVPVNAVATRVLGLPPALTGALVVLGLTLVVLLVGIVGAAVRESVLAPGEVPTVRRVWISRLAVAVATLIIAGLAFGGWTWWQWEASVYRNHRLYRPRPLGIVVETDPIGHRLLLSLGGRDLGRLPPLIPDHGRLMHVFLTREPGLDAFAHLHPARSNRLEFVARLPELPAGPYTVYAQVTYETGFSETLTNRVELPTPVPRVAGTVAAPELDPDDAWTVEQPGRDRRRDMGDGLTMEWLGEMAVPLRVPLAFKVRVREGAEGRVVPLEPYLGMPGHLVVRGSSARVFSHLHPGGNYAMAAQQVFELRDAATGPMRLELGALDPSCRLPSLDEAAVTWAGRAPQEGEGQLAFPFEFTEPGTYRIWVQVRVRGKVRTGVYEVVAGK